MLEYQNQTPDWALAERCRLHQLVEETHLAAGATNNTLRVVAGSGETGAPDTYTVEPGAGIVGGERVSFSASRGVGIDPGGDEDRRDVIYVDGSGSLDVAKGTPAPFDWGPHVSASEQTIRNAAVPAPDTLSGTTGLVLAVVSVPANAGFSAEDNLTDMRAPAPAIGAGAVGARADGSVVPVAPGVGTLDAISPGDSTTPVQDAIDAVTAVGVSADGRYGAGGVLLPPGVTETPGGLHSMGGIRMVGFGREASILRVTDSAANCFAVGGAGSNSTKAYLDAFTIDGGSRTDRTAGSAINFNASPPDASEPNMIAVGFNIGNLQFKNWGGPDPVIQGWGGAFSCDWHYLRGSNYDGSFLRGNGSDHRVRMVNVNHGSQDAPIVDMPGIGINVRIGGINAGGASHRVLRVRKTYSRHAALYVGDINVEPDVNNAGTLPSSVAPAPVELYGAAPVAIGGVHQADELTSDYTVAIGGNQQDSSPNNNGPANNRIGHILYDDAPTVANIGVLDPPVAPSYYWGPRSHIDYQGHDQRALIPLADAATTDQLSSGSGDGGPPAQYGVSARLSSNQSAPSATQTVVDFDTVRSGDASVLDAGTNEFVAPVDGQYRLFWQGEIVNQTDEINAYVESGSGRVAHTQIRPSADNNSFSRVSGTTDLAAGEAMWAQIFPPESDGVTIEEGAGVRTYAEFWRV